MCLYVHDNEKDLVDDIDNDNDGGSCGGNVCNT